MRTLLASFGFALVLSACAADGSVGFADGGATRDDGAVPPSSSDAGAPKSDAASSPQDSGAKASDGALPSSPTLTMISGDGTTIPSQWQAGDPLRVRATSGGQPVAGAKVTFTLTKGTSVHVQAPNGEVTTDGDGVAAVTLNAFGIQPWLGWDTNVVTASWSGSNVAFSVIVTAVPQGSSPLPPLVQYLTPDGTHDLGTAKAGTVMTNAIVALGVLQQGPSQGQALPGWGFRLTDAQDPLAPSPVSCVAGTVLADGKGTIRCDVKVPSTPGSYAFGLFAAGQTKWSDGHLSVN